jgi:hypothetical protein
MYCDVIMRNYFKKSKGRIYENIYLQETTFHRCFLPNVGSVGYSVSEEKIF